MAVQVTDVPERRRFEARRDGTVLGIVAYERMNDVLVVTHTKVDPALEGRGVGGTLVRSALDEVRGRGGQVLVLCPFVRSWLERHPEYQDLEYQPPASTVTD
ncbi:GNAT family N-acetyltransferase [Saccharomonospora sp. NB11]|jgi:predicted GNAT family acetyltransferase|uniref:GNAT family N-acetyltransferase n=1 Tax=Saccharomonospora sp. NB11 TaxID=1642298 RepID=UPI0018D18F7C|nr:GNAT family N-acetyltransferase [Saccharomonospora sp. NB11]